MRSLLCKLVILAELLCVGSARAGEEQSEAFIKRGVELRRVGDDEAALHEFEKGYAANANPRSSAQLGLAEQALGRWSEACMHLTESLRQGGDHPWVQKNRQALSEALAIAKRHVAHLEVTGPPQGARIYLTGRMAGTFPLAESLRVNEGPVAIKVEANGYAAAHRDVTVTGGQYLRLVIELQRDSAVAATASAATPASADSTPAVVKGAPALALATPPASEAAVESPVSASASATPEAESPFYQRAWFWIAVGVVVAGGAVAGVVLATRGTSYPGADHTIGQP